MGPESGARTQMLAGKRAVVTGGGGGIGRGISELFAAHGAHVVVAESDAERAASTVTAITDAGGEATACVVDVTVDADVTRLADEAGDVDVLVNNVGHYLYGGNDFVDSTPEQWARLYDVNLRHVFAVTHALLPRMIGSGRGGAVVNISTVEAFRGIP
ncbi:MAG: SDR family NAD(P)-dependent oxidoreductase, partial [Actinobacteria bacterium]|nr:SDR family NAD(P)-dependent oxidoreductase [Actinomycetota bacterium]